MRERLQETCACLYRHVCLELPWELLSHHLRELGLALGQAGTVADLIRDLLFALVHEY